MTMQLPTLLEQHVKPLRRWVGTFSHSPDLAHSDFHLFGKLKEHLSGKRFASDQEVENETKKLAYQLGRKFLCRRYFEISVTLGQMLEPVWRSCGEII
jgi:hypothetical protein